MSEEIMNKLVKGSIAGAAGIALLLGGAGTLALWNDSADIEDTTVSSGTLTIETAGITAEFADGTPFTSSTLIVPGDTVNLVQEVTIDAVGDTMLVKLGVDAGPITAIPDVNFSFTAETAAGAFTGDLDEMTAAEAESITSVVMTGTFPASLTGTTAQGMTIDLDGIAITLTQVLA
jgi:alternate signal-mediated exported protein